MEQLAHPSGLDADVWRQILCSAFFGHLSGEIRDAVACMCERLCTEHVDAWSISLLEKLSAGQECGSRGCEAACQGVLLIDAANAFNSLNRTTALLNIRHTCPEFAVYLINTYRRPFFIGIFIHAVIIHIISVAKPSVASAKNCHG